MGPFSLHLPLHLRKLVLQQAQGLWGQDAFKVRVCRHKADLQGERTWSLPLTKDRAGSHQTPWLLGPEPLQTSLQAVGEEDLTGPLLDEGVSVCGSAPVGRQI